MADILRRAFEMQKSATVNGTQGVGSHSSSFQLLPPPRPASDYDNSCTKKNCGEAGCTVYYGNPVCICPYDLQPPDASLRCSRNISKPIPDTGLHNHQPVKQTKNQTARQSSTLSSAIAALPPLKEEGALLIPELNGHQGHLSVPILQVVTAVISSIALLVFLLTVFVLTLRKCRRRHRGCDQKERGATSSSAAQKSSSSHDVMLMQQRRESGATMLLDQMAVVGKNPAYFPSDFDQSFYAGLAVRRIPRDCLTLLEEIGQGAFGKVYKGEMLNSSSDTNLVPVAVKILKRDASRETRQDFRREVDIMGGFHHDNILRLIGIANTDDDLPCMVFEFMENGDLADFLRKNDPAILSSKRKQRLSLGQLVDMSTQIANGMVYLASQHFIHRDLATRNCLVSADLVVKISDFGMSRDVYTSDYYKIGGARMLPVRWMPPEALKYGRFTTDSDIWAYGVILWEIFTFGKQPYYGHSNEEVIRFIEEGILLQKPESCPDTVYHVMLGCWRTDPKDRFPFERIRRYMNEYAVELTSSATQLETNRRYRLHRRLEVTAI